MTTGEQDTPKPTPVEAPRRGKFLSPPVSSPSSSALRNPESTAPSATPNSSGTKASRGKFLGAPSSASTSANTPTSTNSAIDTESDTHPSIAALRSDINTAKVAAMTRRKALGSQRNIVFDNLDEAEDIVLSLLHCAAEVSGALSDMTTAKLKGKDWIKSETKDEENTEKSIGTTDDNSFEGLAAKVRANGNGYLTGVKKLHKLLAPHAALVKSYRNHDGEASTSSTEKQKHPPEGSLDSETNNSSGAKSISDKIIEGATSNMYAARVEKRLAMERCEILKEMIRLEELESENGNGNTTKKLCLNVASSDAAGNKRNHESMAQQ